MEKIICSKCKSIEEVEQAPASTEAALCSECRKEKSDGAPRSSDKHLTKRSEQKTRDQSIPRKEHGTRVMLPITCMQCGETDTLDYVPKGADLDEVLCSDCARERFGSDSAWARIERSKQNETGDREWKFECDECGRVDYLPFEPKPDRDYQCNLCRLDHDTPSKERLRGKQKAAGGVFIRRSHNDDE